MGTATVSPFQSPALRLLCAMSIVLAAASAQEADRQALFALRRSLKPQGYGASSFWARAGWLPGTQPCGAQGQPGWKYITCDGISARVTTIDLSQRGTGNVTLLGSIAWGSLGPMEQLTSLLTTGQRVSGALVGGVGPTFSLPSLKLLDMTGNNITLITDHVTALGGLQRLNLRRNPLSGPIPPSLAQLSALTRLDLSGAPLTGPIPTELFAMTTLRILSLEKCRLSGDIPSMVGLVGLRTVLLGFNNFSGAFPELPSSLASLRLQQTLISGNLPQQLLSLPSLSFLNVSSNQLSGALPGAIWSLTYPIDLHENFFQGTVPVDTPPNINVALNCLTNTSAQQQTTEACGAFYNQPPVPGTPTTTPPPPPASPPSSQNIGLIVGLSVTGGILLLILLGVLVWCCCCGGEREGDSETEEEDEEEDSEGASPSVEYHNSSGEGETGGEDEEEGEEEEEEEESKDRRWR